jgi:hypothetical protein
LKPEEKKGEENKKKRKKEANEESHDFIGIIEVGGSSVKAMDF